MNITNLINESSETRKT